MKTILLDRDGVLNPYMLDDYVKSPSAWVWQKKSIEALQVLAKNEYQIIVVTNQSCINRKIVSYRTIHAIHSLIKNQLSELGVTKIHFAICHHISEDKCQCRKPNPENINKIINTYQLEKNNLIFIGDSPSDMEAGQKAGIQTIALKTGNKKMEEYLIQTNKKYYQNLEDAVSSIIANQA